MFINLIVIPIAIIIFTIFVVVLVVERKAKRATEKAQALSDFWSSI